MRDLRALARQVWFDRMKSACAQKKKRMRAKDRVVAISKKGWGIPLVGHTRSSIARGFSPRDGDLTVRWEGADNPLWMSGAAVAVFEGEMDNDES